jgi:hypothetical protein
MGIAGGTRAATQKHINRATGAYRSDQKHESAKQNILVYIIRKNFCKIYPK